MKPTRAILIAGVVALIVALAVDEYRLRSWIGEVIDRLDPAEPRPAPRDVADMMREAREITRAAAETGD